jgi:hypothetical protein
MSKKQNIKRTSRYSDAKLKKIADYIFILVQRDAADFAAYGITLTDLNDFTSRLNLFANFESDDLLESNKLVANQKKIACRETLETAMRYFFTIAKFCFSKQPAVLATFGDAALTKQTADQLIRTAQSIATAAVTYLPQLASAGVTANQIQVLQAANDAFDEAVRLQIIAISRRTVVKEQRIEAANNLYTLVTKFATYGKLIWRETNYPKYKDYILYAPAKKKTKPKKDNSDEN